MSNLIDILFVNYMIIIISHSNYASDKQSRKVRISDMIYIDLKNSYDMCYKNEHGVNVKYMSSGFNEFHEDWIHAKRYLESYELLFVTRGEIYLQEDEQKYVISEGNILILSPFRINFGYMKSSSPVSFYWVKFDTNTLRNFNFSSNFIKVNSISIYKMISMFKQLVTVHNSPEYPDFTADLIISLILAELLAIQKGEEQKSFGIAKKVAEWVQNNAPSVNSIDVVAEKFGYHKDYISKLFKASYKISLKQFINNERINLAKNLLLTSNYSVHQIAEMLRFENDNLFIKFFTYHETISPNCFRKRNVPI